MDNRASLEAEKPRGSGIMLILLVGLGIFAFTRKAKSEVSADTIEEVEGAGEVENTYETQAPWGDPSYPLGSEENPYYTEIPETLYTTDEWYEKLDIANVLGWTLEEYKARKAELRTLSKEEWTWEDFYADNRAATVQQAMDEALYYQINAEQGGSWVNGVLTPPDWWDGSVTAWSNYIAGMVDIESDYSPLAAEVEETTVAPPVTTPSAPATPEPVISEDVIPAPPAGVDPYIWYIQQLSQ